MAIYKPQEALKQYRHLGLASEVSHASPYRLIQLLFEGALSALFAASGAMERKDYEQKAKQLDKALGVLSGLRSSLDLSQGELAENLDRLYEYMSFRLLDASQDNDIEKIKEVMNLLRTIKSGWDDIPSVTK